VQVLLCYKHYENNPAVSHIGLGITSLNCAKYLNSKGIKAFVLPVVQEMQIYDYLRAHPHTTHVVIAALWVRTLTLSKWCQEFAHVQFAVNCHSNIGFLQHEPEAISLIRAGISLEESTLNYHVSANSIKFQDYIEQAYGGVCIYLPNMYYLSHLHDHCLSKSWDGGTLRVGIFGAMRALKNFNTAVGAALYMARELKVKTEVWVNVSRKDSSDADVVLRAIRNSAKFMPLVELVEYSWAPWPAFRKTIGSMHILLQPSFSETFNGVVADGIAHGVPSVVSNAISWVPEHWKAQSDNALDIGRVGINLLRDHRAHCDGLDALKKWNKLAFKAWLKFLEVPIAETLQSYHLED
jgi:hypothetical protein